MRIESGTDSGHDRAMSFREGFERALDRVVDDGPEFLLFGRVGGIGRDEDHLMIAGLLGQAFFGERGFASYLLGGKFGRREQGPMKVGLEVGVEE